MPKPGVYEMVVDADTTRRAQVVASPSVSVVVYLKGQEPSALCKHDRDPKACNETLAGRHFASVLELRLDGIYELEEQGLVLPNNPRVGDSWLFGEEVGCPLFRKVVAFDGDSVTIHTVARCPEDADAPPLIERWRRGGGREFIETRTGARILFRRVE